MKTKTKSIGERIAQKIGIIQGKDEEFIDTFEFKQIAALIDSELQKKASGSADTDTHNEPI